MLTIKMAEEKDLNFIKNTYKLLDSTMMNLLKQLMDIAEDEGDEQHSDEYWKDLIQEKTGYILIAFQGETPTGMAVVEKMDEQEAHLEDLLVWPEFQKQGIGKSLVNAAKDFASERGYKKMSLNVLSNNESARNLYKAQSFEEVKVSMICNL
jgi:ribosomal protein S18 acetylase RimI-like enzyme